MMTRILLSMALAFTALPSLSLAQAPGSAQEFLDGKVKKFSTKGHAKAKGLSLTISYPNSWLAAEGERPNIVQKFTSEGGRGLDMAMIQTREFPIPDGITLTKDELKELVSTFGSKDALPSGAVFVDARATEIEGIPASTLEFTQRLERAGGTLVFHVWQIIFVTGKTMVQIQFLVSGVAGSEKDVERRMAVSKPLFFLMANSIILPDKWTK